MIYYNVFKALSLFIIDNFVDRYMNSEQLHYQKFALKMWKKYFYSTIIF